MPVERTFEHAPAGDFGDKGAGAVSPTLPWLIEGVPSVDGY
jgi:hypothetical protein